MPAAITDSRTLSTLVQPEIPQELFDIIYDFTFTIKEIIEINRDYKPPSMLQVNGESRDDLAFRYYTTTTFHSTNRYLVKKWLLSLTPAHVACLQNVRYDFVAKRPASRFVYRAADEVEYVDEAGKAEKQRKQGQYWLNIIRGELRERGFRADFAAFLTAQAWTVDNGVWKIGAKYRFGDDPRHPTD